MYGDFSRVTFDPANHYSAVLIQQGRVQLDADFNEQTAALLHQLRTMTADLIGPHGGPNGDGFKVTPKADASGQVTDLGVGSGHYYVDGILCENSRYDVTYLDHSGTSGHPLPATLPFLVYLRVFERLVTAVEDPSIREVALGDPGARRHRGRGVAERRRRSGCARTGRRVRPHRPARGGNRRQLHCGTP
jgi:hypothetical protein